MQRARTERLTKSVAQVFTVAKFRRVPNPRNCHARGYYHVWVFDMLRTQPATGQKCQCGLLDWTERQDVSV